MPKADVIVGWSGAESEAIPGSVAHPCALCGHTVWLAPSGQRKQAQDGAAVWCIPCAEVHMRDTDQIALAPGALEEFRKAMRGKAH